jgi:nucleotide-binding universal stress UspA family protein
MTCLEVADDYAQRLSLPIVLLHVIDEELDALVAETQRQRLIQTHKTAARERLEEVSRKVFVQPPSQVLIEVGNPARRICEVATKTHAQLLVVGTRGHGRLGSAILGSTVTALLHLATIPVLVVPRPRGQSS